MKSIGRNMFAPLLAVLGLCLVAGCSSEDRMPKVPKMPKIGKRADDLPAEVGGAGSGGFLFHKNCASCHGESPSVFFAQMMKDVPAITDPRRVKTLDQKWLYKIISEGGSAVGRRAAMPPFKEALTDAEIRRIVSYLNGNPV